MRPRKVLGVVLIAFLVSLPLVQNAISNLFLSYILPPVFVVYVMIVMSKGARGG